MLLYHILLYYYVLYYIFNSTTHQGRQCAPPEHDGAGGSSAKSRSGQKNWLLDKYSLNFEDIHFAGTKFEMILYPDAGHGFLFKDPYESHVNAADVQLLFDNTVGLVNCSRKFFLPSREHSSVRFMG